MIGRKFADGIQVVIPAHYIITMVLNHTYAGIGIPSVQAPFKMQTVPYNIPQAKDGVTLTPVCFPQSLLKAYQVRMNV
jgi:hypothetical protein